MITIKINSIEYSCPTTWADITMRQYLAVVALVVPEKFKSYIAGDKVKFSHKEIQDAYSYMAKVVEVCCGIPYEVGMKQVKATELQKLWYHIERTLKADYEYQYAVSENGTKTSFLFEGETYYLPTKLMTEETAGELVMAQLLQDGCKQLENGSYIALTKLTAVLCRKAGEWYEDYDIEQRAEHFLGLPMDTLLYVGFFLQRLQRAYMQDLQIFTAAQTLTKLRQVSKISKEALAVT